jgi:acyl carrier protein
MHKLDQDILDRVQSIAVDLFGPERFGNVALSGSSELFTELGLSSLEIVSLLTELDSAVGLRIPVTQVPITELFTISDLVRQIADNSSPPTDNDPIAASMKRGSRRRRRS